MPGHTCFNTYGIKQNALPITMQAKDTDLPVHYGHLVPRVAVWFSVLNNRVFLNSFAHIRLLWKGEGSQ
jgi:hypothetical protein